MTIDERIAAFEARLASLEARIAVLERSPFGWQPPATGASTSFADLCPCNPKNGGSGVCGCVLGGTQVICSATAQEFS